MDVFKIELEQAQINNSLVENTSNNCLVKAGNSQAGHTIQENEDEEDDEDEEQIAGLPAEAISFEASAGGFNLHFFDTPEDSSTQGGCSEPASVESCVANDDENNYQYDFIQELDAVISEENKNADNEIVIAATTITTATTTSVTLSLDNNLTTTTTSTTHLDALTTVQAIVDDITAYEQHNHQKQQSSSPSSTSSSSCSPATSSCSSSSSSTTALSPRKSNNFLPKVSAVNHSLNFVSPSASAAFVENQYNNHQSFVTNTFTTTSTGHGISNNEEKQHANANNPLCANIQATNCNIIDNHYLINGHNTSATNLSGNTIEQTQQSQQQQHQGNIISSDKDNTYLS